MNARADTRQRILESARDLIYARSYADVGVASICERAGVKKGSFYHFFPSKRDLTLAVLEDYFMASKTALLDRAFAPDIPPLERLQRLALMLYEHQKALFDASGHLLGCPFGNLAAELSTQDEPIRRKVAGIFLRVQAYLRQTLEEAQAQGELDGIDTQATAQAMFAYIEGVLLMAKTRNDPEVLRRLLPAVSRIRAEAAD